MRMNPASTSALNPGTSLNFDATALHAQEEAEYQLEEQERQNELRQLLSDAFEDLSDEDVNSSGSLPADEGPPSQPSQERWEERDTWHGQYSNFPTLTPAAGQPPTHHTPATVLDTESQGHYIGPTHGHLHNHGYGTDREEHVNGFGHPYVAHYEPNGPGYGYPESSTPVDHDGIPTHDHPDFAERGEIDGAATDEEDYTAAASVQAPVYGPSSQAYPSSYPYSAHTHAFQYYNAPTQDYQQSGQPHSYPYPNSDTDHKGYGPTQLESQVTQEPTVHTGSQQVLATADRYHGNRLMPSQQSSQEELENYRVRYTGVAGGEQNHSPPRLEQTTRPTTPGKEYKELQEEFLHTGGPADKKQQAQLEILYKAKSAKLDEVTEVLRSLKEESDREIRVLRHKLQLMQDERDGMAKSLEQSRNLLQEVSDQKADVVGKLTAVENQVAGLAAAKEEVYKKLQTAESTIESLHAQLTEYETSDALLRARDQHDNILAGAQRKHEAEMLALKQQLDAANHDKMVQAEEIDKLKSKVSEIMRSSEASQIERAETVNRLSRSLEETQRHCQELLEAGTGKELANLRVQLQDAIAGRSIAQDMNAALQEELTELKEQVNMYESLSSLGVIPSATLSTNPVTPGRLNFDDSYTQLGIKSGSSETPASQKSEGGSMSAEDTLQGLKGELERCLKNYRSKREQASRLQAELKAKQDKLTEVTLALETSKKETVDLKSKLEKTETELSSFRTAGQSAAESHLQRELERLQKEKDLLLKDSQDLQQRLEEVAANEERMGEVNRQLSHQMAQMVKEFDEDKQQAVNKCQEACMRLHEDSKHKYYDEVAADFSQQKEQLVKECQGKVEEIRAELERTQKELQDVKELYVAVCRSKDKLEEQAADNLQAALAEKVNQIKTELQKEKEAELSRLKEITHSNHEVTLATAKLQWQKEQTQEMERQLQEQVAQSKIEWLREQKQQMEEAVREGKQQVEQQWQWRLEQEKSQWEETHKQKMLGSEVKWKLQAEQLQSQLNEVCKDGSSLSKKFDDITKELQELKTKHSNVSAELQTSREQLKDAEERISKQKDKDFRSALKAVEEQRENDYKLFLSEHKDTLDKALASARQQFQLEKTNLEKKHQQEMDALRNTLQSESEGRLEEQLKEDKSHIEAAWQQRLEALAAEHTEEKSALMQTHRDNLVKALEEAKLIWLKEYETKRSREEKGWEKEKQQLLEQLAKKEEVIRQKEDEQTNLQLSMEEGASLRTNMSLQEKDALLQQLNEAKVELEDLERRYQEEMGSLQKTVADREGDIAALKGQLTQLVSTSDQLHAQKKMLETKLEQEQAQVAELQKQKQELLEAYRKVEQQQGELEAAHKARQQELMRRLQHAAHKLKGAEQRTREQLDALRDQLEHEHSVTMETMKKKMVELRQGHLAAIETARRDHAGEVQLLRQQVNEIQRNRASRAHTPTQVNLDAESSGAAADEIRSKYLDAMNRIKSDVLKHVSLGNERAAEMVRREVMKERHNTAARLRRYYLQCLAKVLDAQGSSEDKQQKMRHLKAAFDKFSQQDSGSSTPTSPSAQPSHLTSGPTGHRQGGAAAALPSGVRSTAVTPIVDSWFKGEKSSDSSSALPSSGNSTARSQEGQQGQTKSSSKPQGRAAARSGGRTQDNTSLKRGASHTAVRSGQRSEAKDISDIEVPRKGEQVTRMTPTLGDDSMALLSEYENVLNAISSPESVTPPGGARRKLKNGQVDIPPLPLHLMDKSDPVTPQPTSTAENTPRAGQGDSPSRPNTSGRSMPMATSVTGAPFITERTKARKSPDLRNQGLLMSLPHTLSEPNYQTSPSGHYEQISPSERSSTSQPYEFSDNYSPRGPYPETPSKWKDSEVIYGTPKLARTSKEDVSNRLSQSTKRLSHSSDKLYQRHGTDEVFREYPITGGLYEKGPSDISVGSLYASEPNLVQLLSREDQLQESKELGAQVYDINYVKNTKEPDNMNYPHTRHKNQLKHNTMSGSDVRRALGSLYSATSNIHHTTGLGEGSNREQTLRNSRLPDTGKSYDTTTVRRLPEVPSSSNAGRQSATSIGRDSSIWETPTNRLQSVGSTGQRELHKPVALVTRHTQVPSPAVTKSSQNTNRRQ